MGVLLTIGRILCVIINIIFFFPAPLSTANLILLSEIIGLVLFVVGMIVKFGESLISSYYQPIIDSLEKSLSSAGFGSVTLDFKLSDLVGGMTLAFILTGLFLLIITIFGMGGACCKVKCMLIGYVVMVSLVLIGQIIFIIIFYAKQELVTDKIKENLKNGIQSDFQGLNGTNVVSLGWNFVNQKVECCGIDSYNDFTGASQWITNYGGIPLQTPLSCCKELPSSTDYSCATSPTTSNNYLNTSCFDKLWNEVVGNAAITATVLAIGAALQLLLIIIEFALFMDVRKNQIAAKG